MLNQIGRHAGVDLTIQVKGDLEVDQHHTIEDTALALGEAFKKAVEKAKSYIFEGDIMQVVLSQRMSQKFEASPLALYESLRTLNPSPYMFYYHMDDHHVVGASPEILVRLEDETVTVRPIAGTRPRGKTEEEDK